MRRYLLPVVVVVVTTCLALAVATVAFAGNILGPKLTPTEATFAIPKQLISQLDAQPVVGGAAARHRVGDGRGRPAHGDGAGRHRLPLAGRRAAQRHVLRRRGEEVHVVRADDGRHDHHGVDPAHDDADPTRWVHHHDGDPRHRRLRRFRVRGSSTPGSSSSLPFTGPGPGLWLLLLAGLVLVDLGTVVLLVQPARVALMRRVRARGSDEALRHDSKHHDTLWRDSTGVDATPPDATAPVARLEPPDRTPRAAPRGTT